MEEQKLISLEEKMTMIQSGLTVPKNQFNSFGQYKYRSCEDILEAIKPLLRITNTHLTISDEVVMIGNRYYVKAVATIWSEKQMFQVCAYAREPEVRKGMDESQITGATSSYARKYALNGLFCIDDTKDADSTNDLSKTPSQAKNAECSECGEIISEKVKKYSMDKFGKSLCFKCQKGDKK